jgi:transglutaminase-like putative cysteine protease
MSGNEEKREGRVSPSSDLDTSASQSLVPVPSSGGKSGVFFKTPIILLIIAATIAVAAIVVILFIYPGVLSGSGEKGDAWEGYSGEKLECSFELAYNLHVSGEDSLIEFTVVLPTTMERRQEVSDIYMDPQPQEIFEYAGNRYARFVFHDVHDDMTISISGNAALYGYDLGSAMEAGEPLEDEDPERYLISERYLEKDDGAIVEAAYGVGGEGDLEVTRRIFDYVLSNMEYSEYNPGEVGAAEALTRGRGDCTEFSDLMVAMCRARDIPARTVEGYIVDEYAALYVHNWVEVYLEEFGWVPFDPTFADGGAASFSEIRPRLLRVSQVRDDEVLGHYHYWYFTYNGDPVNATESIDFEID